MKVLYTGSFNPFHNGHEYVYNLACQMFGKESVWIGIGQNSDKKDIDKEHLKFSIVPITKNVICYDGLTSDIVKQHKFELLIRGVRSGYSMEDEHALAHWNKELCDVTTILIPSTSNLNQLSSGAIRELHKNNKDVLKYMNKYVFARWSNKLPKIPVYFGKCCCGKSTYLKERKYFVIESDKEWKPFAKKYLKEFDCTLEDLKRWFYDKNDHAFSAYSNMLMSDFDWDNLFASFENFDNVVFDIPIIGSAFYHIPTNILGRLELIKCSASKEDRRYFAEQRKVNPKLIECNNHFYKDPPFWDEELIIKRM